MTTNVTLSIVVDEGCVADLILDHYEPELINSSIDHLLDLALNNIGLDRLHLESPHLVVALKSDEVRPSLYLSAATIKKLSDVNCSFDFDPYCSQNNEEFWIIKV